MKILNDTDDYTDAEVYCSTLEKLVDATLAIDMKDTQAVTELTAEVLALMFMLGDIREETMDLSQIQRMEAWTEKLISRMPQP